MKANRKASQSTVSARRLGRDHPFLLSHKVDEGALTRDRSMADPLAAPGYDHALGGTSHSCPPLVQAKLTVNEPGDKYEQEADRVAEQVMHMPEPALQRQADEEEEEEKVLQPKSLVQRRVAGGSGGSEAPPIVNEVLRSPCQPLDPSTRQFMESRFGHDFGQVRVHTDAKAVESSRAVNARAFTVGRDLVFGSKQYAPHTATGQRLLAHELAHVVQQSGPRKMAKAESSGSRHTVNRVFQSPVLHQVPNDSTIFRQEATFIAGTGNGYLRNAQRFHRAWGYPNVRRARSLEEIIRWVSRNIRGTLSRLRIVTHANNVSILTALLRGGRRETTAKIIETARGGLMSILARSAGHITSSDVVAQVFAFLRGRQANIGADILQRLCGAHDPRPGSNLHGLVWWMLDRHYAQNVRVTRGRFPNRRRVVRMINANIRLLRNALSAEVAMEHPGQTTEFAIAQRDADLRTLEGAIARFLRAYVWNRNPITRREASEMSRRILRQSRIIQRAIARGTFEGDLETVRSLVGLLTSIEIRGCRIGQNRDFLRQFQRLFEGAFRPRVSAPDYFQFYGHPGFRSVPNTDQALQNLWNNPRVQQAFIDWWNAIHSGRPDPDVDDFKTYLRSGEVFPSQLGLITVHTMARDSMVNWLVRHNYHITSSDAIRRRFFRRGLRRSLRRLWVDWLQDRRVNPAEILFPPDPRYDTHIVEISGSMGDFPAPREGVTYA
jgi:hypothetical protein